MAAAPEMLGPFRLERRIAVGGMAEVWLATVHGPGGFEKRIAVKLLHPQFSADDHFVQMLVEEAKIAVQLSHPNIAQTFDLGQADGRTYLTMEHVEGTDLFRLLRNAARRERPIPIDVAAHVAAQVCAALDYAHTRTDDAGRPLGIIHRDVSPQNVLLSLAGEVKLVDFGIAKAALRSQHTGAGIIKGKYQYMSPEQAWGDPIDHRSDLFSAGVVFYETLTGRMLHSEDKVSRLLAKVRQADIPRPETRRPDLPRALGDLVMRALARDREQRYRGAREFQEAIERFLGTFAPDLSPSRLAALVRDLADAGPAPDVRHRPTREIAAERAPAATRQDLAPLTPFSVLRRRNGGAAPAAAGGRDPAMGTAEIRVGSAGAGPGEWTDQIVTGDVLRSDADGETTPPAGTAAAKGSPPAPAAGPLPDAAPVPPQVRPASALAVLSAERWAALVARRRRRAQAQFLGGAVAVMAMGLCAAFLLTRTPPPAVLDVISVPAGALVRVDGRARGRTPASIQGLDPRRTHRVQALADHHAPWERITAVTRDHRTRLIAILAPVLGTLEVTSDPPGAEIVIDGASRAVTPARIPDLAVGQDWTLELRLRGYHPQRRTAGFAGETLRREHFVLEPAPPE